MKSLSFLIVSAYILSGSVFAAETGSASEVKSAGAAVSAVAPSTGTSISTAPTSEKKSVLEKVYLSYFGTYHGPSTQDLGSPRTVDIYGHTGPKTMQQNFDSEAGLGYRISSDVTAGIVVPFFYFPVVGGDFSLGDVGVKVSNSHLLRTKQFNMSGNLILQEASNLDSRLRKMSYAVKTTPSFRYMVPKTSITLGAWTEAKYYAGVIRGKTFKLYANPYVNYALSDRFSFNVGYANEWNHFVGNQDSLYFNKVSSDLEPGFIWNITKKIMVNPFLQMYTTEKLSWKNTAFATVISASIL